MRHVLILLVFCSCFLSGCLPDIYLIDRQTVLEMEASGDWQELDAQFHTQGLSSGPEALESGVDPIAQRQVLNMTHSDAPPQAKFF
ncbi:MAG: hypothetical protein NTX25_14850 [Proteobacteria bacterium]|nr:hypothetical protein [Pseudomonadota bacterium]